MKSRKQLYQSPGYWNEKIENEIYIKIHEYMANEGINQSELAKRLGFTKGYISQMLNGDLNFSLKKLTELALKIGVVPDLKLRSAEEYYRVEENRLAMTYGHNKHITQEYFPGEYSHKKVAYLAMNWENKKPEAELSLKDTYSIEFTEHGEDYPSAA